jgi:hypothetical protein
MARVAVVDGVSTIFYATENPPPHCHLRIAEHHAVMDIVTLKIVEGSIPIAKRRKVMKWARSRQADLERAFVQAIAKEPVEPIA